MTDMDEKMPSWFYEFADAVAATTLEILRPHDNWLRQAINEAVHEAVLTCLHDAPLDKDEAQ